MFIFLRARGLADFPITINGSLFVPAALLQAKTVRRCLFILKPGAEDSSLEARLLVGSALKFNPVSVSYTHLDVYKRQVLRRQCGNQRVTLIDIFYRN